MKIYISSHSQELARELAKKLEENGHTIVSSWINVEFLPTEKIANEAEKMDIAVRDVEEVKSCDCVYHIAGPDRYPGGKFVEVGVALGLGKPVMLIGRRENCLMYHPLVYGCREKI